MYYYCAVEDLCTTTCVMSTVKINRSVLAYRCIQLWLSVCWRHVSRLMQRALHQVFKPSLPIIVHFYGIMSSSS